MVFPTIIVLIILIGLFWYLEGIKIGVNKLRYTIELHWINEKIEKKPEDAQLYIERGGIHSGYNNYFDSRIDFQAALEIDPNSFGALYNLAWINKKLKQYKDAWKYIEAHKELDKKEGNVADNKLLAKLIKDLPAV